MRSNPFTVSQIVYLSTGENYFNINIYDNDNVIEALRS